jgi:RNA polymerase sigma factor (sigma-70 family)
MPESTDVRSLVELWRKGDQRAAEQLFTRYVDRLVPLARRRISQRLASRVDPEDVVQSVFRTFFGGLKEGRFDIQSQDDLCKLLMRITIHKTLRHIAFHKAAKRDPSQETIQSEEGQEQLIQLLGREPTPDDAVAFLDQLEHLLSRLGPQERQILEMRLQGYSNEDIAAKLGIYDRKIRRLFERVRGLAEQEGFTP